MSVSNKQLSSVIFLDIDGVLIDQSWQVEVYRNIVKITSEFKKAKKLNQLEKFSGLSESALLYREAARSFSSQALAHLRSIVDRVSKISNVQFVICSAWRQHLSLQELQYVFTDYSWIRDAIVDKTEDDEMEMGMKSDTPNNLRGRQIEAWLNHHSDGARIKNYVILDDQNGALAELSTRHINHFVQVNEHKLLTKEDADLAVAYLSNPLML